MSRKVFLSVLGSSSYSECMYVDHSTGSRSDPVRFIQEAILNMKAHDWEASDAIIILLTKGKEGSRSKNWEDSPSGLEGLKTRIKKLGLLPQVFDIDIPDGNTTAEIWEIFKIIFLKIQQNDHLYFDITHGYRYLPMLMISLGNYSKFLKEVTIERITYGNYDGRNKELNEASIIDLLSFSKLQDWTDGINEFINNGASKQISRLLDIEYQEREGAEKQALRKFQKALNSLTQAMSTIRGNEIYSGKLIREILDSTLLIKKKVQVEALEPIIVKLEDKISKFEISISKCNGDIAVDWCIEHNLIQQAYTLGQEHIISLLCDRNGLDYKKLLHRSIISSTIGYINHLKKNPDILVYDLLIANEEIFSRVFKTELIHEIAERFARLSGKRNSLNHAGMTSSMSSEMIIKQFKDDYYPIIQLLR